MYHLKGNKFYVSLVLFIFKKSQVFRWHIYAKLNNIASALRRTVDWRDVVRDIKHTVTCIFLKTTTSDRVLYTYKIC